MTSTLSINQTSQTVTEWSKTFTKQVIENLTSSVTFMKQLTVVAISTIAYMKNVFPEDSYTLETFSGVKLRILKKKCKDESAQFLSTALIQAFEAFDKKYLQQLVLCFYEDDCKVENLIEYHIFEYSYSTDGAVAVNVHSRSRDSATHSAKYTFENVRERTIHLIRTCVVITEACQTDMPSTYEVSLRLYYNEDAPPDYQAPGFMSANESEDHLAPTVSETVKLGWVETPFHKLVARSFFKPSVKSSHEAIPSQNPPTLSNDMDLCESVGKSTSECETQLCCPCNKYETFDVLTASELLTCQYCKLQQHAACFGILRENVSRVTSHCCAACHDVDTGRAATDGMLVSLGARKRESLCIFRRTLEWCSQVSSVGARELVDRFDIQHSNALKVLKLLHSHGIIEREPDEDSTSSQKIIPDRLRPVIAKLFHTSGGELVDRILADSHAAQEGAPDPAADVLGRMAQVSLHGAANIGRLVDPGPQDPATADEALREYREAVMTNDTPDELPGRQNPTKRKLEDRASGGRTGVKVKRARLMPK